MSESQYPESIIPEFKNLKDLPVAFIRSRGELPHLYLEEGTYFVTFRLWDAIIKESSQGKCNNDFLLPDAICALSEPPLRQGQCILKTEPIAEIVQNALCYFQGKRYYLYAWCIMPNHAHVVVTPYGENTLSRILHTWKSFTAHEINRYLGRTGALWERESFDHLVRNKEQLGKFIEYTENNPVLAGFCEKSEDWPYSSSRAKG